MKRVALVLLGIISIYILSAYNNSKQSQQVMEQSLVDSNNIMVAPTENIVELEPGLSTVLYEGDYGFDEFLSKGGATSDLQVVEFLSKNLLSGKKLLFQNQIFGCSTLSARNNEGDVLFGRNFDWQECNALILQSRPENGYDSISTVNMDFITGYSNLLNILPESVQTLAALYAPMDGMNEKGLCVSILMIQDSATINQSSGKSGITTTTTVRLLLDKASNVDEAISLLEQYDMNASMGMMVHFAISDATGRSVVVEYINNEMVVIETPVATNFYLAEGSKYGIGTAQSHERYNILMDTLKITPQIDMEGIKNAMDSVSKDNFGEFESTEWSIIYNQSTGEVRYYHRENYEQGYNFNIFE